MTAPALPREVWCFVEDVGDEQFPDTHVTVLTSERDLAAWRDGVLQLKEAELSPIGRYVLAGTEHAETEARVVAWIRSTYHGPAAIDAVASSIADAIERGEHRRDGR